VVESEVDLGSESELEPYVEGDPAADLESEGDREDGGEQRPDGR
jgi:hypothetical protein